ncbi:hypothetical protein BLOT_007161 [Blomia tropicalis]|nr:hypothetical protein BLOT_007161 [Blomia tropicalis]
MVINHSEESVGIGSSVVISGRPSSTTELPHLSPEGAALLNEPLYDCIIYLIYCPEHDKIAVTNIEKSKCTWLPFVILPDDVTWQMASHDGVETLIGRNDAEMEAEEAERTAPIYEMHIIHLLRLMMPNNKTVVRLAQFVHLLKNEFFPCCQGTDRVNWLPASDILSDRIEKAWGPELRILSAMLTSPQQHIIIEFGTNNALYYFNLDKSPEQILLKANKLTAEKILDIFTDYVEHCYPAFYMCFESFRAYMLKYGHSNDLGKLSRLYHAFCILGRPFIEFHEFLIGLIALEPNSANKLEARAQLVFRYYDIDRRGSLNAQNVTNVMKDANPSFSVAKITVETQRLLKGRPNHSLSYNDFYTTFFSQSDCPLNHICRSNQSIVSQISASIEANQIERNRINNSTDGVLRAQRSTKGTCWSCRAQQYEYATHYVTIDTSGRCVEPSIMNKPIERGPPKEEFILNREKYSAEYVFPLGSVPNIFLDLVRVSYYHQDEMKGLLTLPEEWSTLLKYVRILINELTGILSNETKLVKTNAPTIVIGDLHGNVADLLLMERQMFVSFPIIAEQLIFLGNYAGICGSSVECLLFVFSLKLCSPNKVFLLRGTNEQDARQLEILRRECCAKYGSMHGKIIYELILPVFAQLPVAAIIDDLMLCTHSGIPITNKLSQLLKLPKEIRVPERDAPIVQEIISRIPKDSKDNSELTKKFKLTEIEFGNDKSSKTNKKSSKQFKHKPSPKSNRPKGSKASMEHRSIDSETFQKKKSKPKNKLKSKSAKKNSKISIKSGSEQKLNKPLSRECNRSSSKARVSKNHSNSDTFDENELKQLLSSNGLTYLIRSNTPCALGFRIEYDQQCLTVFSCSNYADRHNQAAVLLVDHSNCLLRFMRYEANGNKPNRPLIMKMSNTSSSAVASSSSAGTSGSKSKSQDGPESGIAYSTSALQHNHHLIEYCRTSMSALAGCTAGIIGFTSFYGFAFYLVMVVVLWLMLMAKAGKGWKQFFTSRMGILTNGFIGGLTTYVLFWTFLYGMVHVY